MRPQPVSLTTSADVALEKRRKDEASVLFMSDFCLHKKNFIHVGRQYIRLSLEKDVGSFPVSDLRTL